MLDVFWLMLIVFDYVHDSFVQYEIMHSSSAHCVQLLHFKQVTSPLKLLYIAASIGDDI